MNFEEKEKVNTSSHLYKEMQQQGISPSTEDEVAEFEFDDEEVVRD